MRLIRPETASRILLLLVMLLLPCWNAVPVASAQSATEGFLSARGVLVRFKDGTVTANALTDEQRALLTLDGASDQVEPLGEPGTFLIGIRDGFTPQGVAAELQLDPSVDYAEVDRTVRLDHSVAQFAAATDSVPTDWALNAVDAPGAWKFGTGKGIIVAVLDTGVSASHPDLAGRVLPGWNFVANDGNAADDAGHGTFVAGLIAGSTPAGPTGVAPGAKILPVKILDSSGVGSTASFVAGINYAVNAGAKIINISASGASDSAALDDALTNAESHGVLVVASSGNDANEQTSYPAAVPTVLAVSATDQHNKLASFSSFGPYVDLAAPGVDIWSSWWSVTNGNGHATASGSSASAPLVAGAAAILAGLHPDASPATLREILTETARDIESPGIDAQTGYGLLDAYAAAQIADPPQTAARGQVQTSGAGGRTFLQLTGGGFTPGEPVTVWTQSADGYRVNLSLDAGTSGQFSADLGPLWQFPQGTVTAYAVGTKSGRALDGNFDVAVAPIAGPFKPLQPVASTADRVYFPQTGHTLAYGFKQFWDTHGGLAVFGYPISEEFSERDAATGKTYTVQYFERYRFEYHPEFAGTPYEVSLGLLGVQTAPQQYPTAPNPDNTSVLYFATTRHTLTGAFRTYWEMHGGLEMFGYPISEPFEQGGVLVQYFERARFELHSNLPAGSQVLLSRLGVTLAREDGYLH